MDSVQTAAGRFGKASCVSTLALLAASMAQPAYAQAQEDTEVASGGLREIVVTARRVEERAQDVPLSITTLDNETLRDAKISQVSDLAGVVPNLNIFRNGVPGGSSITLRGVQAQGLPRIGLDNRLGIYLDGVYLARTVGQSFELADMERMEVLKGPQGTLFGRNVTAGAINIITANPSGEFGGIVEGGIGTMNRWKGRITLNLPETAGFSARFTYSHNQQDGDIRNLAAGIDPGPVTVTIPTSAIPAGFPTGGTPFNFTFDPRPAAKTLGMSKSDSYFAAIRYRGIDNLTVDYKYDRSDNQEANAVQNIQGWTPAAFQGCVPAAIAFGGSVNQCGVGSIPVNFGFGVGVVSAPPTLTPGGSNVDNFLLSGPQSLAFGFRRPEATSEPFTAPAEIHAQGHSLTINLVASDNLTFRSITGYRKLHSRYTQTNDGGAFSLLNNFLTWADPLRYPTALYPAGGSTPYPLGLAYQEQRQSQWSQELQAIGKAAPWLDYLVGAYYFREKGFARQYSVLNNAGSITGLLNSVRGVTGNNLPAQSSGIFPPQIGIPPFAIGYGPMQWGLGSLLAGDHQNVTSSSRAVFGRVTLRPVKRLEVVLGGRYTRDHKTSDGLPFLLGLLPDADPFAPGFQPRPAFLEQTFKKFTWDGTVTFHVTDDINVYGRYATAFLSGGQIRNSAFNPETTQSGEVGFKSELFDRRLRFNGAAFWQKSKDFQFINTAFISTALGTVSATGLANLGSLTTKGFELDINAAPVRGVSFGGSLGYVNQKYNLVNTGGQPVPPPDFSSAPEWTTYLYAQYDTPALFGDAFVSVRLDANYRSKFQGNKVPTTGFLPVELLAAYGLPTGSPADIANSIAAYANLFNANVQAGDVWLVNGRISLNDFNVGGSKARLSGYVRNIFDTDKAVYTSAFGYTSGANYVRSREFGADLTVTF